MTTEAPQKIAPAHLQREAYLYIRQSTLRQVMENTESTECVFHANWTAVPWQTGRLFHGKVGSWSDATRGAGTIYSGVDSSVNVG